MVEGGRGSGKTFRAVQAAPDGSAYVVASEAERCHCRDILRHQGRRSDSLRFITLEDVQRGRMRGLSSDMIRVDHDVEARAQERVWELIQAHLHRT